MSQSQHLTTLLILTRLSATTFKAARWCADKGMIPALEDIVTSLRQQDGVQWAVFFDAKQQALTTTKNMVQDDSTVVFAQPITMDGQDIGSFKLGLSTAFLASALSKLYMLLAVSTLGVTAAMVIILTRLFTRKTGGVTTRPGGCEGGSGSRQSAQERVPGQYVSRVADTAPRHLELRRVRPQARRYGATHQGVYSK